jgi:hypothetical protein
MLLAFQSAAANYAPLVLPWFLGGIVAVYHLSNYCHRRLNQVRMQIHSCYFFNIFIDSFSQKSGNFF